MMIATDGNMNLHALFEGFGTEAPELEVVDITQDSRTAVRDGLFIACRGTRQHGLDFVGDAVRAGVGAVAWEPAGSLRPPELPAGVVNIAVPALRERLGEVANRFFARPSEALRVTGITGTNGKTTTAWLVTQAMGHLGDHAGYLGTLGFGQISHGRIAPGQIADGPAPLTTPDCISFHRQLRELADAGARHAVAEVSSHALDQDRTAGVRFETVAFTNLTRDHLDYHPDLSAYGAAKARLFAQGAGTAVINLDDAFGRELAGRLPAQTRLLGVSLRGAGAAVLHGTLASVAPEGLVLELRSDEQAARLSCGLWGSFNAENLLVAAGILMAYGWSLPEAAAALSQASAPPGRMERVPGAPGQPAVLVDYAHTPDALHKALAAVREHCPGEVWCVFGCGGDRDRGKRPTMGTVAASGADRVIVTDDNPRTEDPQQIIADILSGVSSLDRLQVVPERADAIARAIRGAKPGDAVLIAGKGHETVQITRDERRPFSDVAVAMAALSGARQASARARDA